MTKKEIVKTISEELGLTQLRTKEIVQKTFDAIIDTLVEEKRIELRNFGVFEVKQRAPRKARNPRTGDRVDVPEKFVVTFKPGKEMEERVKQMAERLHAENREPVHGNDGRFVRPETGAEASKGPQQDKQLKGDKPNEPVLAVYYGSDDESLESNNGRHE